VRSLAAITAALLCSSLLFVGAQGAQQAQTEEQVAGTGVTVQVAEHETFGSYLTDQEGNSLYLYLPDRLADEGEGFIPEDEVALSTCYDECAENWPPYLLRPADDNPVQGEVAGDPIAGEGTQADLLDEVTREDTLEGWTHVTYRGWPLYYFVGDEQPGDANGQGLNDVWYLVSPMGEPVGAEQGDGQQEGVAGNEGEAAGEHQQLEVQTGGAMTGGAHAPTGGAGGVQSTEGSAATVQVDESESFGQYLVDADGMSLYMYQNDSENNSACNEECVQNWPPLTVEGEATAGEGVDSKLLSTFERSDNTVQAAYNGLPLYRYVRDTAPGDTLGQNLGRVFFLVSPTGESITEEVTQEAAAVDEELLNTLMADGEQVFSNICATCHGAEGQGNIGPRFDGNSRLARSNFVINMVLNGFPDHGMPAFRDQLSDQQIAGVATFIRNSWSNDFGTVAEEEVGELR
jgi:predicted lipoprotein with Yx(FWY)xxD motif/cytochrome c5